MAAQAQLLRPELQEGCALALSAGHSLLSQLRINDPTAKVDQALIDELSSTGVTLEQSASSVADISDTVLLSPYPLLLRSK